MAEINRRDLLMMGLSLSVSARMAGASSLFVNAPGGTPPRKSPLTGLKESLRPRCIANQPPRIWEIGVMRYRSTFTDGMALVEVLELLPHDHPQRAALIAQVRQFAAACEKYQDPATGLWYQVVDKGNLPENWLETSSSCMYTYTLSRAIERGYIAKSYAKASKKGYSGVLTKLSRDENGFAHIADICEGTNVGDLNFYLARPRSTDDFHGLGAFLIMNEQLRKKGF